MIDENKKFVLSIYPSSKYITWIGFIQAEAIESGKKRTYILGTGKNAKNAWKAAAEHLRQRFLKELSS